MTRCEGCNAEITWFENEKTGRRAPVDLTPSPTGNVTLNFRAGTYRVLTKEEMSPSLFGDEEPRFTLHFATCPQADHFRRCAKCHRSPCACHV